MAKSSKPTYGYQPARVLGLVLLLGALTECGRSVKGLEPHTTSVGGADATAGEASAGAGDGVGASSAAGGSGGGPSGGGRGGSDAETPIVFYTCLDWSDLENQPIPGQSGPAACPRFSELRFTQAFRDDFGACYWEAALDEALVPPPDTEPGDCCYGIGYLHCR